LPDLELAKAAVLNSWVVAIRRVFGVALAATHTIPDCDRMTATLK
jgi:hypothetical protein